MSSTWKRCVSALVTASLVLGLIPAPAIAEAIDEVIEPVEVVTEDDGVAQDGLDDSDGDGGEDSSWVTDDSEPQAMMESQAGAELALGVEAEAILTEAGNWAWSADFYAPQMAPGAERWYRIDMGSSVWASMSVTVDGSEVAYGAGDSAWVNFPLKDGQLATVTLAGSDIPEGVDSAAATVLVSNCSDEIAGSTPLVMEDGKASFSASAGQGEGVWYEFVAPEDGDYAFYSTGDYNTYGAVAAYVLEDGEVRLETICSDLVGGEGDNFRLDVYLNEGQTYYLNVRQCDGESFECAGYVERVLEDSSSATEQEPMAMVPMQESEPTVPMTLGETYDINVGAGESWLGELVVPTSGTYMFYSSYVSDVQYNTYGSIEDSGVVIATDDNRGVGDNFAVVAHLEGGHAYQLRAQNNYSYETIFCAVRVVQVPESAESVTLSAENAYSAEGIMLPVGFATQFTAPEAGVYSFSLAAYAQDSNDIYGIYGRLYTDEELSYDVAYFSPYYYGRTNGDWTTDMVTYHLDAGQTVWLRAYGDSELGAPVRASVAKGISLDDSVYYSVRQSTFLFDNHSHVPTFYVYLNRSWKYLYEGTDFELASYADSEGNALDDAPVEVGSYVAVYRGIGDCVGTFEVPFEILDSHSLAIASATISKSDELVGQYSNFLSAGEKVSSRLTVTGTDGHVLKEGVHYTLRFVHDGTGMEVTEPLEKGGYYAYVEAIPGGGYEGECEAYIPVLDPTDFEYIDLSYTGDGSWRYHPYDVDWASNIKVTDPCGNVLREGRDYEVKWFQMNSGAELDGQPHQSGSFYARVAALGSRYKGERSFAVTLSNPFILSNANISCASALSLAEPIGGQVSVRRRGGIDLVEGRDYTLVFFDSSDNQIEGEPTVAGNYSVRAQGMGEYGGQTYKAWFVAYDPYDLSNASISLMHPEHGTYAKNDATGEYQTLWAFLSNGRAIVPEIQLFSPNSRYGVDLSGLVEGVDYQLSVSGNVVSEGEHTATVTVSGMGDYHGETTTYFQAFGRLGLQRLTVNRTVYLRAGGRTEAWSGGNVPTFLATGSAVEPVVIFDSTEPGITLPVQGVDFEVSYLDGSGSPVAAPVEPDSYVAVLTGTEDGRCSGELRVPFRLVGALDVRQVAYVDLDFDGSSEYLPGGVVAWRINEVLEDVSGLAWRLISGNQLLVEGLDYVVSAVRDKTGGFFDVVLSGIGDYFGSVHAKVYDSADLQEALDSRDASVNDGASVYVDGDGVLASPLVAVDGLVEGVDYVVSALLDADGRELGPAGADVGDTVYVRIQGVGAWEGATRDVRTRVYEGSNVDLSREDDIYVEVANAWSGTIGGRWASYLLRNETPKVRVHVIGTNAVYEAGQGFAVTTRTSDDGGRMTVTAVADGTQGFSGTASVEVGLVDSYDLPSMVETVYVSGSNGERYERGTTDPQEVHLTYAGVPYVPEVGFPESLGTPDCRLTLLDGQGQVTAEIDGPGAYTLNVKGVGTWGGKVAIPLVVTEDATGVSLDMCDITLGEAVLSDGAATPEVTVFWAGHVFVEGEDYTVSYSDNTEVGSKGLATITACEGGLLSGRTGASFTVLSAPATDISKEPFELQIQLPANPQEFVPVAYAMRAYATRPAVRVVEKTADGMRILGDTSVRVTYGGTGRTGVSYVTVTGRRGYTGTLTVPYVALSTEALSLEVGTTPVSLGGTASFTCLVGNAGGAELAYQWQYSASGGKNWADLTWAGANTPTLRGKATKKRADNQIYRCVVTASDGRVAESASTHFDIVSALGATASAEPVNVGGTTLLTCDVSGSDGMGLSFRWQYSKNGGTTWKNLDWDGSDTESMPVNATKSRITKGITYRCVVGAADGRQAITNAIALDVPLVATVSTGTVAVDSRATFSCEVGNVLDATLAYQWQYSLDNGGTWRDLTCKGADTAAFSAKATQSRIDTQVYRCVVTASDGRVAESDAIGYDVLGALKATAYASPVVLGGISTFACKVSGGKGARLSYQWQYSSNGGKAWADLTWDGADTAIVSATATQKRASKQMYRCVVTAEDGRIATSEAVRHNVLSELEALAYTGSAYVGENARFRCYVLGTDGHGVSYQWQYSNNGGTSWKDLSWETAKDTTLVVQVTESRARKQSYRCVVSDSYGRQAITEGIPIDAMLGATVSTKAVRPGKVATFTCAVSGLKDAEATYRWQYSNNNGQTWGDLDWDGADTAVVSAKATQSRVSKQMLRCVVEASDGRMAQTDAIGYDILPDLEADALTTPVNIGDTATFTCSVDDGIVRGATLSYKWQYSNNGGKNWADLEWDGADTAAVSAKATQSRVSKQMLRCAVTADDGRSVITDAVGYDVRPTLLATASTAPVRLGGAALFLCHVRGIADADLSYQWQYSKDGGATWRDLPWDGSSSPMLTVDATKYRASNQVYHCVVTADDGRVATTGAIRLEILE